MLSIPFTPAVLRRNGSRLRKKKKRDLFTAPKLMTSPLLQSHSKINGTLKVCSKRKQHLAKRCTRNCLQASHPVEIENKSNSKSFSRK
jgi:hypothetical protein